jgi:uncharacterized protein YecT (DUF1311 family)
MKLISILFRTTLYLAMLIFIIACKDQKNNEEALPTKIEFKSYILSKDTIAADSILENCLGMPDHSGETTIGMTDCYELATSKMDTLIDYQYIKLYQKLDNDDRINLKSSQDKWKKFYEAEADFLYDSFKTWTNYRKYGHGSIHTIMQAEWKYKIKRQRLIDLTNYDDEIFVEETK